MIAHEFQPRLHDPAACSTLRGSRFGLGNFLTPDLVAVFRRAGLLFELSAGDFLGHRLFGVTVFGPNVTRLTPDRSACFRTLAEALEHVDKVARGAP